MWRSGQLSFREYDRSVPIYSPQIRSCSESPWWSAFDVVRTGTSLRVCEVFHEKEHCVSKRRTRHPSRLQSLEGKKDGLTIHVIRYYIRADTAT